MVARPVRAQDDRWLVDGWGATEWIDAEPGPARWDDVLAAGDVLHTALALLDPAWPAALDARTSPWAIADRVAWGVAPVPDGLVGRSREVVTDALEGLPPDARPVRVVHGDLAGNVLFPLRGAPVIIDLSPYRRPVAWAHAVAVVDQICWHGSPVGRRELVDRDDLTRAVVFRIVAAALQSGPAGDREAERAAPLLAPR
jgi:hypothetical protein